LAGYLRREGLPRGCDVFRLREFQQSVVRALTADAGLLDAAERRRRVRHDAAVEAHHAGLEGLADPQAAAQVPGVDVGDQAELGVVGPGQGVVLGGEADHGSDRAEDLGAEDAGARRNLVDDGRLVEVTAAVRRPAAGDDLAAVGGRGLDELGHLRPGRPLYRGAPGAALLPARADPHGARPGRPPAAGPGARRLAPAAER